jgi:hypothetical protein
MNAMQPTINTVLPAPGKVRVIVNFVAFQIGWFACVLGGANGWSWTGTAVGAAIVAGHVVTAPRPSAELKLAVLAVLIGALWDSSLAALGWISYASGTLFPGTAPNWILALWALFATTLNVSFRWLKGRWLLAAILGAVAGPLSYWAGVRLGALVFAEPVQAVLALAIGWAILMPALLALTRRYDGMQFAK